MKRRDMLLATPLAALAGCSGSDSNPVAGSTAPMPENISRTGSIDGSPEGVVEITAEMNRAAMKAAGWGDVPDPDPLAHIVVKSYTVTYELFFTQYDFGQLKLSGHSKSEYGGKITSKDLGGVLIFDRYLSFSGKDPSAGVLFSAFINLNDTDSGEMLMGHPGWNQAAMYGFQEITIHRDIIVLLRNQAIEELYG